MWVVVAAETPSLTREFIREIIWVLECTQTHPPGNQYEKGPICLWVGGEVTESGLRAKKASKQQCSLFDPSPTYSTTMQ